MGRIAAAPKMSPIPPPVITEPQPVTLKRTKFHSPAPPGTPTLATVRNGRSLEPVDYPCYCVLIPHINIGMPTPPPSPRVLRFRRVPFYGQCLRYTRNRTTEEAPLSLAEKLTACVLFPIFEQSFRASRELVAVVF